MELETHNKTFTVSAGFVSADGAALPCVEHQVACSVSQLMMFLFVCFQVHVVLKLWKSGFSLDNGELRNYNDPGNANFLEAIRRG